MIKIINSRPIVFLVFFFLVGIAIAYYFNGNFNVFLVCAILSACVGIPLFLCKKHLLVGLYVLMVFVGGSVFLTEYNTDFSNVDVTSPQEIKGMVTSTDKTSGGYDRYTLSDVKIEGIGFTKKVFLYSKQQFAVGDIIEYTTIIKKPQKPRNLGSFDEYMYLASQKVGFTSYDANAEKIGEGAYILKPFYFIRDLFLQNIDYMYTKETAPIAKAMFLGEKSGIDQDVKTDFEITGAAHLLAISGLHVGIISLMLNVLLSKLKVHRNIRYSLNIAFMIAYMLITALSPSVVRAVIMFIFLIVSRWLLLEEDTFNNLALAMAITLIYNPTQLFTAGFLLSYGAVFGILCLYPPINRALTHIKLDKIKLSKPISASLAVGSTTLPLTAYFFKGVALASPITNLFTIPLATLIVVFTALSCFASLIFLDAGKFFAFFAQVCIITLLEFNKLFAQTAFGYLAVYNVTLLFIALCYFAVFVLSDFLFVKIRYKVIITIICLVLAIFTLQWEKEGISIRILDVGNGDSIHIKTQDADVLVDNGGNPQSSQIYDYTKSNKITYDYILITNDRTKNLKRLINEGYTTKLIVPQNYLPKEYDANLQMDFYGDDGDGGIITIDDTTRLVWAGGDGKNSSFMLYYMETPVCLLAQNNAEYLTVQGSIPVIKLGGSGGENSLNPQILNTISPKYAIISVKANDKKNPDAQVLELLKDTEVFRTDINGTIIVEIAEGEEIKVSSTRE